MQPPYEITHYLYPIQQLSPLGMIIKFSILAGLKKCNMSAKKVILKLIEQKKN